MSDIATRSPGPGYLKIKDFGCDKLFQSVDELKGVLSEQYKGKHVTIVYPLKSGIHRMLLVSINAEGCVNETYGQQRLIDFAAINAERQLAEVVLV